jgi:hypothetical protein
MPVIECQIEAPSHVGIFQRGQAFGWEMFQIYAEKLVRLIQALRDLEDEVLKWDQSETERRAQELAAIIKIASEGCKDVRFVSARKQADRIMERIPSGTYSLVDFSKDVTELRTRLIEDMEEGVFFCENNPAIISKFFKQELDDSGYGKKWTFKSPDELFDSVVVHKFQSAAQDISESCRCYVSERHTACVFHAMRVVEIGLLNVAKLAQITDLKPSWGAILSKLEKYAFRMEYDELPDFMKPHRTFIRDVIPRMHAVQHAWRNKVDHATLIPIQPFDETEAKEILGATESFMRVLATQLP